MNTKETVKTHKNIGSRIFAILWFPLSFLLWEAVLNISTDGYFLSFSGLFIAGFSVCYGIIWYFFTTSSHCILFNRILQGLSLFVLSFFYGINYFLFCEFRVFYDPVMMFSGAFNAASEFSGDIFSMLLTPDGAIHLVLFFLPFLGYLLLGKKINIADETPWEQDVLTLLFSAAIWIICVTAIKILPVQNDTYGEKYSYNAAVSDFGMATGIRLEIKQLLSPKKTTFDYVETTQDESEAVSSVSGNEDEILAVANIFPGEDIPKENPVPPEKNEMELDFDALSQKDNGKYADLDEYVASLEATSKNEYTGLFKGKNLIFITAEAFTAEVINKQNTPTLYRLSTKGIQFTDYYQPTSAGTTGGEYSNIFGMLPTSGGSSMKKTADNYNFMTIASRLSEEGYYGKAYHNGSYTYYDRNKTHINLGYSDGFEAKGNGLEEILTKQWPASDLEMIEGTLPAYIDKEPFNIYYMSISGHSLYTFSENAMAKKHKDEVSSLTKSEPVKAYLACQLELEAALTYLVDELEKRGIADNTVIVISTDHFPYGLDQNSGALSNLTELYGQAISNNLYRDHNRLIIWSGCLEDMDPIVVDTPTSSIDILPTLCNLFEVRFDSRLLPGRDVFSEAEPLVFTLGYEWKTDKGMYSRGKFSPSDPTEEIPDGYVSRINNIVKNKITYSKGVLNQDYFRHLFGDEN